MKAKRG